MMTSTKGILIFFTFLTIIASTILPVTCAWTYFVGGNTELGQYDSAQDIVDAVNFCNALPSFRNTNRILKYREICRKIIELINSSGYN
uniref:Secreted protein n=1 Tax=Strongyloides papillosus TaxID=174720 RepID=A0A0N5BUC8_STREA